jgi:hypothetical protein
MRRGIDELQLLRGANPVATEPDRARTEAARAALVTILEQPLAGRTDRRRGGLGDGGGRTSWGRASRSSRRLGVLAVALVLAGGTAIAATDPLGWWSSNPTSARYRSNPALHVSTPAARILACSNLAHGLHCAAAIFKPGSPKLLVQGRSTALQGYAFVGVMQSPAHGFTRARMLAVIRRERAAGTLSVRMARRFRSDLAAVPDSFFSEFEAASRYGTYSSGGPTRHGLTLVPPAGTPILVVCESPGGRLSCQDLNGDTQVPVGAGIYAATATRDWRYRRVDSEVGGLPPGISFTPAEYRLLFDLLMTGKVEHSTSTIGG